MADWRVYCIRNKMLQELYFDCTDDVHTDLRKLEEEVGSKLAHWDFEKHDLICFDLDTYGSKPQADGGVCRLEAAPAPPGWTIIKR